VGATVPIGISNRHIHLSSEHAARLFGSETLTVERTISQPGQFAATQRVTVHGASGRIDGVRVVGPPRGETQLELAASDARTLGVAPPVQASGTLAGSLGGLRLEGPAGSIVLDRGVIVPRRHLHLAVADGERLRLADGDVVSVRCGVEPRAGTLHGILVRCGPSHATELHLDVDEARALGLATGDLAVIASRDADPSRTRRLITERDVRDLFARGAAIPAGALLTPSARDRARALGMRAP
jgi:putative phosphotransacetylase